MSFETAIAAITKASAEYVNQQGRLSTVEFVPVLRQRHPELFTADQVLDTCDAYVNFLHTFGMFGGLGDFRGAFEVVFYGVMDEAERQRLHERTSTLHDELWRVIHAYAQYHGGTLPLSFACDDEEFCDT